MIHGTGISKVLIRKLHHGCSKRDSNKFSENVFLIIKEKVFILKYSLKKFKEEQKVGKNNISRKASMSYILTLLL